MPVPHPQLIPPDPDTKRAPDTSAPSTAQARLTFVDLYEQHFGLVWRTLRHLGVPASLLEDSSQEVWLVVHRQLPQFAGRSSVRTWLFGIALNVAHNVTRKQRRRPAGEPLTEEPVSLAASAETLHAQNEMLGRVHQFLDTLDEERRALFALQLLEGASAAETGQVLNMPVASVYHRVRSLRRTFQRWWSEHLPSELP